MGKLRVGRFLISSRVNGPGRRFVIWFQGCSIRCRGCLNPEFHDEDGGHLIETARLVDIIRDLRDEIEGVTFTGGEPLAQAMELVKLAGAVKSMGLTVVCFTGYEMDEILKGNIEGGLELLEFVDVLIDGPYVEEKSAPLLWRGSTNQDVYFLTECYAEFRDRVTACSEMEAELKVGADGVYMTGIFDVEFWEELRRRLGDGS